MIKYITVCGDLYNQTFCSEAVAMMDLKGPSKSQAFVDYLEEHKNLTCKAENHYTRAKMQGKKY